ncbi:Gamma-butyrobetaine dioxygenase [Nymphon striatum]|nr:Gamma-butyrobetaine dioxygenase [Nymphon striatum]
MASVLRWIPKLTANLVKITTERPLLYTQIKYASFAAPESLQKIEDRPIIKHAMPNGLHATKVVFSDKRMFDFKYIWLRDNCHCSKCIEPSTKQKIMDSPSLDVNIVPKVKQVNENGQLDIIWADDEGHHSVYDSHWLLQRGECFYQDTFEASADVSHRPPVEEWDRMSIWKSFPEVPFKQIQRADGLNSWLEMVHKYGIAVIRDVPTSEDQLVKFVNRFAYVKETAYGITFDVKSDPEPVHLANTSLKLDYHTDLNYREKSPGLQLLHCLEAHYEGEGESGGQSMFVDGFKAADWLQENHPSAFHLLSTTPIRFSIYLGNKRYVQHWPIICVDNNGDIQEIHHNNRTMGPLQVPNHMVIPFYHAYKIFTEKIRDQALELRFNLVPGDLVAFNNRRILHGRTEYDTSKMKRHLKGCYVDIDEAMSHYDSLLDCDYPH